MKNKQTKKPYLSIGGYDAFINIANPTGKKFSLVDVVAKKGEFANKPYLSFEITEENFAEFCSWLGMKRVIDITQNSLNRLMLYCHGLAIMDDGSFNQSLFKDLAQEKLFKTKFSMKELQHELYESIEKKQWDKVTTIKQMMNTRTRIHKERD